MATDALVGGLLAGGLLGFLAGMIVVAIILAVALYVYMALVLSTIATKLKRKDIAWIAWIPIANLFLLPILADKEWPWGFMFLVPIANLVFFCMWTWKIFEKRKYPGWLSLVWIGSFIPVVGALAGIGSLVIWGLVAWRDA